MAVITFKCPNCGGDLRFDPDKQQYKCEFCLSPFTQEQLEAMNQEVAGDGAPGEEQKEEKKEKEEKEEKEPSAVVYNCPSCGAEIVTDDTTAATFCYYCHNPVVLSGRLQGKYRPVKIIPFAVNREKALQIFNQWIGQKKYIPKAFYSQDQIEKMAGVYFPYWLYDCQVEGKLDAQGTRLQTWVTGNVQFTRTEEFDVSRDGTMEVANLTRAALSKANRKLVEGVMPFEMDKAQPFHMGYLSGFMAENRDIEADQFKNEVESEVIGYAENALRSEISGYNRVQIRSSEAQIRDPRWNYALLPVWTLTYKDPRTSKIYYFACNGQTGKVCGELPVDNGKLAGLFAMIFLPVLVVLLIVGYFL